jgi:hypothetical protein
VPGGVDRSEVNERQPRSAILRQDPGREFGDRFVRLMPGRHAVLRDGDELTPTRLGEQWPAVLGQRQRRPAADREQRGQPRPGGHGEEVRMRGEPVTRQVVARDPVPGHPGTGHDRRPARPGHGGRPVVDDDRDQKAVTAECPDHRRGTRAEQVEADSVHSDDEHMA